MLEGGHNSSLTETVIDHSMRTVWKAPQGIREQVSNLSPPAGWTQQFGREPNHK